MRRKAPTSPQFIPLTLEKMTLDKVKTLHAAEKYLELGKIPAAVKEYCKIVESEPDDFSTLNILGDLHVRVGNKAEAIACFRRIADHYREQEFALKAIAMFKKVDRLQPNDIEIATSLAELYAQQDLIVEARAHYLMIANAHAKAGATQAGLDVLRKIADLEPQNTEVRIKLAESYLSEGMNKEAAASFATAAQSLLARGALDEALEVFAKSLELDPADHATLDGLLAAHSARGTADEAAELIAHASQEHPDDADLISMLARAYIEAEDAEQAESATTALIAREPSAYLRMVDVACLYLRADKIDDAMRIVASISEQMLAERQDTQLVELLDEVLTSDADNVQALRLLVYVYSLQRDKDNLESALERLAEAAQAAGLAENERYALTQLTSLFPEGIDHVARLNELGGPDEAAVADALLDFASGATTQTEAASSIEEEFVFESQPDVSPDKNDFESKPDTLPLDAQHQAASEMEIERGFAFEADNSSTSKLAAASATSAEPNRRASIRQQELESVDFYIEQGYVDIAIDTLNLLENQFGAHPDIDSRRQKLNGNTKDTGAVAQDEASAEGLFNRDSSNKLSTDAPVPAQVIDPGLAEVFEEYRVSAEVESSGNGDYETHYNLGLAYKEMDLFEEALEEFQSAISLVSSDDGTPRYVQCCNLLAHCFMQKGVPQLAVKWLNKGLSAPNASEDERQALRFELAAAHEQAGDLNRAVDLFTEIYGVNVSYRGVNERLRALQSRLAQ
ncbi:MAG TPA: tetratricopeptide repeat protein [Pyrinomonadaceae bacterium]|nr:tetratricopeptide repeat protein [Pyrinomonadaceae bacterium]